MNQIVLRLVEQEEARWLKFAPYPNEMTISQIGRLLFPKLEYYIEGLDADKMYEIVLEMHQVDNHRYKFDNDQWVKIGPSLLSSIEANQNAKKIRHVDGVKIGWKWMTSTVNFDYVKVTNNSKCKNPNHIILHSKHKYVPVLTVFEVSSILKQVAVVRIDHTQFIAVQTYQNKAVSSLKSTTNPRSQNKRNGFTKNKKQQHSSSSSPKQAKLDVASPALPIPPVLPQFLAPNPFLPPNYLDLIQAMAPHVGGFLGAATSSIPSTTELEIERK